MKIYPIKKAVSYAMRVNKIELNDDKLKNITKKLLKAGFSENVNKSSIPFIVEAIKKMCIARHNPLKTTASSCGIQSKDCPLCTHTASHKGSMIDVKLADDRKARFCMEHNVAIPCSVE